MKMLVINSGSSSIRSTLFEHKKEINKIAEFHLDGIGLRTCKFIFKNNSKNIGVKQEIKTHEQGVKLLLDILKKNDAIKNFSEIKVVGHRVVHGGEKYTQSAKINTLVIKEIEKMSELAPLHNPANLAGIKACAKLLKTVKQVAVFDTSFHQTMEEKAYLYPLPRQFYEKHSIRKYGFHGTSHKYVVEKAIKQLKKKNAKIVSCHLGNGSSITASLNGKSIDTSMGFTPLEGIPMGTRSGSIDPSIIFFMEQKLKMKSQEIEDILNHQSGLKAISRITSDMRDIYAAFLKKDKFAILAIEIFSYQIAKYCGAYAAALNGLDALIFTGGIGEKAFYVREKVCNYLEFLGLKLNEGKNRNCAEEISDKKSKIKVLVTHTDEELQIANESVKIIKK